MAFTGPAKGSTPRTLRERAITVGTTAAGFQDAPSPATYDAQAGVPTDLAHGRAEDVPGPTVKAVPPPAKREPFKLGGK